MCYNEAVLTPKFKGKAEDIWHSVLQSSDTEAVETVTDVSKINSESLFSTDKTKDLLSLLSQSSDNITVKLPKYENANTIGCSNHVDIVQGLPEWFTNRIGMITASKLPALLGMNGHKEFDTAWFCINNKLDESIYRPKRFKILKEENYLKRQHWIILPTYQVWVFCFCILTHNLYNI